VFNFGLSGAGPLQELLCLRRLLDAGVRPTWVLVEVLPPVLRDTDEETRLKVQRLAWNDVAFLRRYVQRPGEMEREWVGGALVPWHTHRFCLLSHFAPAWLPWFSRQDHVWRRLDAFGWLTYPHETVTPEAYARELEKTRQEYAHRFQQFRVAEVAERALGELLTLCRREGIGAALFVMPEGSEFRGWYPPDMSREVEAYLARLAREHGVAVTDARAWVADGQFIDGHHLLPYGAAAFSARFGREALRPLLERRPRDAALTRLGRDR
jgi:hypothetical protein